MGRPAANTSMHNAARMNSFVNNCLGLMMTLLNDNRKDKDVTVPIGP
jgi:hypothetical protein